MNRFKQFWNGLTEPAPGVRRIIDPPIIRRTVNVEESLSNFTPRAQQVLGLALKEAARLHHNFVGTEHLLLGLFKLGQGTAVNVLRKRGLDLESVGQEVEKQVGTGPSQIMAGYIPYTPRVRKVLALAQKEAKQLNHTYVGSEHLLLGLLREGDGVAAMVLASLGVELQETRNEILRELDPNITPDAASNQTAGETDEPTTTWNMSTDPMENLTPRAREVFRLAREEANSFKQDLVGTECLLLGLIRLGQGVAVNVLLKAGLDLEIVRREVKKAIGSGSEKKATESTESRPDTGYSEGIKTVMAAAQQEAKQLYNTYIGTEHLLLAMLQAGDEVAAKIMRDLGVDLQQLRKEILRELIPNFDGTPEERTATETRSEVSKRVREDWRSKFPKPDPVDLSRRYDVYCIHHGERVVYRNVIIKATKGFFASDGADWLSLYLELEQPDGKTIFLQKHSVFKFCDPGATAGGEPVP